jgi:hypothetical protein
MLPHERSEARNHSSQHICCCAEPSYDHVCASIQGVVSEGDQESPGCDSAKCQDWKRASNGICAVIHSAIFSHEAWASGI